MAITKFDENFSRSDASLSVSREVPVTEDVAINKFFDSIRNVTVLSKDERDQIKQPVILSSDWALWALKQDIFADTVKWREGAIKALAVYPSFSELLSCGQGEPISEVLKRFQSERLSELLLEASGLCKLKER